jgi:hypothetical protein
MPSTRSLKSKRGNQYGHTQMLRCSLPRILDAGDLYLTHHHYNMTEGIPTCNEDTVRTSVRIISVANSFVTKPRNCQNLHLERQQGTQYNDAEMLRYTQPSV